MQTGTAPFSATTIRGSLARYADAGLDALGVTLLGAEVLILFAGIVARTVFLHPLIWSTECAELLFVWLTMLGAAIAVRNDRHICHRSGRRACAPGPMWFSWSPCSR